MIIIGITLLLIGSGEGLHEKQISHNTFTSGFVATGNTDQNNRIEDIGDYGPFPAQVVVSFDSIYSDLKMRFCPPGRPVLVTENNIEFSNGYAETYDPETGIDYSFEVWGDFDNYYTSMWIESANDARIIVRWKSALAAPIEGKSIPLIAHRNDYSGAPYGSGYGDWVDEVFYIYPDASRTRYSKIYTAFAGASKPFGFDRMPPNYVHEFSEAIVWNYNSKKPIESIDIKALTLANLEGEFKNVSYSPYPSGFGKFESCNIMRINLKAEWKPYIIGRSENVTIRPYELESKATPFQSWTEEGRDHTTALAHMVNWTHFEKSDNFISQVYLEGMIHESTHISYLSDIANGWINPAKLTIISDGYKLLNDGYSEVDRAYHIQKVNGQDLTVRLEATNTQKVIKPVFVVENWGDQLANKILIEDKILIEGVDFRQGLEKDNLVIWFNQEYISSIVVNIENK